MRPRNVARWSWEFMATFKNRNLLHRACQSIADLEPCSVADVVTADQVKLALGELLDIWPDSIAPKCSNHGTREVRS